MSTIPTGGYPRNLRHIRPMTTSSALLKDAGIVVEGMSALHAAVLGAFYNERKGGVVAAPQKNIKAKKRKKKRGFDRLDSTSDSSKFHGHKSLLLPRSVRIVERQLATDGDKYLYR